MKYHALAIVPALLEASTFTSRAFAKPPASDKVVEIGWFRTVLIGLMMVGLPGSMS